MPELMKEVLRGVRKEMIYLADVALKSGAANVGKELANLKSDVSQPSEINIKAIASALKSGVLATGQELMTRGLERMGKSPQGQQSNLSEETTSTLQAMEEI